MYHFIVKKHEQVAFEEYQCSTLAPIMMSLPPHTTFPRYGMASCGSSGMLVCCYGPMWSHASVPAQVLNDIRKVEASKH